MTLNASQVTVIHSEIVNDPLGKGYAGKSNAEIAALLNAFGGAADPTIKLVCPFPVLVKGSVILGLVTSIDGWDGSNNQFGAGADAVLDWMKRSNDSVALRCQYFWNAAADFDLTSPDGRNTVDYLAGVDEAPFVPSGRALISDAAMTAVLDLGMVANWRANELIGISRLITEAEVAQAMA